MWKIIKPARENHYSKHKSLMWGYIDVVWRGAWIMGTFTDLLWMRGGLHQNKIPEKVSGYWPVVSIARVSPMSHERGNVHFTAPSSPICPILGPDCVRVPELRFAPSLLWSSWGSTDWRQRSETGVTQGTSSASALSGQVITISVRMFYPEISPAMKWHQLHNQRLYSNFVFPNCAKFQEEDPDFGEFLFGWRDFLQADFYI